MKRIAILASGAGSNAREIIKHFNNHPAIKIALVVTNNSTAGVINIAKDYNIESWIITKQELNGTKNLLDLFNNNKIDFVVLAGFLLLIPSYLIKAYPNKIINIHPALLPKYGGKGMYGANVHDAVKTNGDTESGISIHFVNEKYDDGAIIFQAKCKINASDNIEDIQKKVQKLEHQYYPQIIEELLTSS